MDYYRGVSIDDTFAEAFPMTAARVIVTAVNADWARTAAQIMTGYASSVIACDAECAVEHVLNPDQTPDGRPGVSMLVFAFSRDALEKAVVNRVGQCIMTCATTACFNGLPITDRNVTVGGKLRKFGDGWQISKLLGTRRFWRIPVMDGEFVCEDTFGTQKGVAGGNWIMLGNDPALTLAAAEASVAAVRGRPGVIMPFPGGVVRSGSKVGSKYRGIRATTNTEFCPTLRGLTRQNLDHDTRCVYEIVIDGLTVADVAQATAIGVRAACLPGVTRISAGNYGGKLGPFHFHLRQTLNDWPEIL